MIMNSDTIENGGFDRIKSEEYFTNDIVTFFQIF